MHIITYKEKVYAYQDNELRVAIHKKIRKNSRKRWQRFLVLFTSQEHICEDRNLNLMLIRQSTDRKVKKNKNYC
jgi:hypothetical protein